MPNEKKLAIVQEVTEKFKQAKGIYFTNYKGMKVEQINQLRGELVNADIEYKVIKKTLCKIAAKNAGFDSIDNLIEGQMGIALGYNDPVAPGKIITEFVKKNKLEFLNISGCIFEKEIFSADQIGAIIDLPTRDQLMANLVGTLAAPMSQLVGILKASMNQLVGTLKSLSINKK